MPLLVVTLFAVGAGTTVGGLVLRRRRTQPRPAPPVRSPAIRVLAPTAALALLAVVVWRWNAEVTGLDLRVATFAAGNDTQFSTRVFALFTVVGSSLAATLLTAAVAAADWVRNRQWWTVAFLASVLFGQNLLANGIKWLVGRPRPALEQLTVWAGTSFPSGHSTAAAAVLAACALVLSYRRSPLVRAALGGGAVALAVMVAGSRVMLGVHWFTDALAGLALGWSWFAFCAWFWSKRNLQAKSVPTAASAMEGAA